MVLWFFPSFAVSDPTTDNVRGALLARVDFARMSLKGALLSFGILIIGKVIGRSTGGRLGDNWGSVFKASHHECPRLFGVFFAET